MSDDFSRDQQGGRFDQGGYPSNDSAYPRDPGPSVPGQPAVSYGAVPYGNPDAGGHGRHARGVPDLPPEWTDGPTAQVPTATLPVPERECTSTDPVQGTAVSAESRPGTGTVPEGPKRASGRDRYFDLLRGVALFRVVLYHLMAWSWLPIVFPSMGIMFALAGNLMARSLKRPALQVVRSRMRRLLPPLWLAGAIGVTAMIVRGWRPDAEGHPGWWWFHLIYWILPLSDPPYPEHIHGLRGVFPDDWAAELAGPLWYIRNYLWYVLLSPFLLWALRRLPWITMVAPIGILCLFEFDVVELPGDRFPSAATDWCVFGACWILGMAHQEGVMKRLPGYIVPSIAPAIALVGLWYAFNHGLTDGIDIDDISLGQALWSFGTVLLLFHFRPSWTQWPRALRRFDRPITLLNSRAVTIYLWHNISIAMAATLYDNLWRFDTLAEHVPWLLDSGWPVLALTWLIVAWCIITFGWVEDVAAKRRPEIWPDGSQKGRKRREGRRRLGAHG